VRIEFGRRRKQIPLEQTFDHEQGCQRAADRHRQIRHADRDGRKFGDALVPGDLNEVRSEPQQKEIRRKHAKLDAETQDFARARRQCVG